jgi:hypothetical protein
VDVPAWFFLGRLALRGARWRPLLSYVYSQLSITCFVLLSAAHVPARNEYNEPNESISPGRQTHAQAHPNGGCARRPRFHTIWKPLHSWMAVRNRSSSCSLPSYSGSSRWLKHVCADGSLCARGQPRSRGRRGAVRRTVAKQRHMSCQAGPIGLGAVLGNHNSQILQPADRRCAARASHHAPQGGGARPQWLRGRLVGRPRSLLVMKIRSLRCVSASAPCANCTAAPLSPAPHPRAGGGTPPRRP